MYNLVLKNGLSLGQYNWGSTLLYPTYWSATMICVHPQWTGTPVTNTAYDYPLLKHYFLLVNY